MTNKLQEIAEKAYMHIVTSKGTKQDTVSVLYEYFAEYAKHYINSMPHKTFPCRRCRNSAMDIHRDCPHSEYIEGRNDANAYQIMCINQDLLSLNN